MEYIIIIMVTESWNSNKSSFHTSKIVKNQAIGFQNKKCIFIRGSIYICIEVEGNIDNKTWMVIKIISKYNVLHSIIGT